MDEPKKLSDQRMGEIALLIFKHRTAKELPTLENLVRDVPNTAKELGLSRNEARQFLEQILPEAVKIRLGCKTVTLDWSL